MPVGAPKGNNNAGKGSEWRDAIRYELARLGRDKDGKDPAYVKGLRICATEFIKAAKEGESWAMKELGDRMDGKAHQSIDAQIDGVIDHSIEVSFLGRADD